MEAEYLEPPAFDIDEAGWYVVDGDRIFSGPFSSKSQADTWIENEGPEIEENGPTGLSM